MEFLRFLVVFGIIWCGNVANAAVPGFSVGTNMGAPCSGCSNMAEEPFLDIFKTGGWVTYDSSNVATGEETLLYQSFLDSNGYPTSFSGGPTHTFTRVGIFLLSALGSSISPITYYQSGDYLLQWTGTASWTITLDASVTCTVSPCKVTIASPSGSGVKLMLTSTGAGAAYMHGGSFIYCGTWNGSSCSNGADTQLIACQAGTYTSCFNPQLISRLTGVKTLRFMQWIQGAPSTFAMNWADRKLPTWYSYIDSPTNSTLNGAQPYQFVDGVPAEVIFALCNILKVDCWFTIPANATDTYVTQFATLAHSSMGSGRAYVEFSNEIWNFVQATGQVGEITAKIDNGSGGAGNILTVSTIGPDSSTPILHQPLVLGGGGLPTDPAGRPLTQIITQTSGTTGGTGTYTVTTNSGALNISSEVMTVNVNVTSNLENAGAAIFPLYTPPNGGLAILYGQTFRAVQVGHLFQAAWGADSARVIRVAGAQNDCQGCAQGTDCVLDTLPTGASHCASSAGGPSVWYSGGPGGTVAANMDAIDVAPYWAYYVPEAWTADPDGGLQSFFTEVINGGLEPTANVTGNCGNGAGKSCAPSDTAHFTLTSSKSLASDPPNGFMVQATMNATNTTSSGHTYLTVDSVAQYPILASDQACPGTDTGAGTLASGSSYVFVFTSAFSGCNSGSITKGWRAFAVQNTGVISAQVNGMIAQSLDYAQSSCSGVALYGGGIPLLAYEGGQDFVLSGTTSTPLVVLVAGAMRDPRMGYAYESMYRRWKSLAGGCSTGVFMQFNDISPITAFTPFEFWGLLENVLNTSSPRYDATINFTKGNPGGRLNFLLPRDVNPASNDNSPVGLDKVA